LQADEYKTRQEDKKNEKAAITEAVTLLKQEVRDTDTMGEFQIHANADV